MIIIGCSKDTPKEVIKKCKTKCATCPYCDASISKDCNGFKVEVESKSYLNFKAISTIDIFTFVRVGEDGWQLFENDEEQFLCLDTKGVLDWLIYKKYTIIEQTIL